MPPTLPKKKLVGVVAVLTVGLTALLSIGGFPTLAAALAVVGFLILLPLIAILGADFPLVEAEGEKATTPRADASPDETPIAHLRERYARGELSDEEFERRLDRLLETEHLAAGEAKAGRTEALERS